nr:hypothetical protein CTI12_AA280650 [Tanacetum cinerariifolium]
PGVKFCAGEGGLRSWEWCGGGGVECRVGKGGEWGWREFWVVVNSRFKQNVGDDGTIESIMTILASLDSPVNDEDVVHYALKGLPEKYNQVKENSKKDKIRSKPDKNRKRGEAGKSQKQLQ